MTEVMEKPADDTATVVKNTARDNAVDFRSLNHYIPELGGYGIIKSLAALTDVMRADGAHVLNLDAGLPEHMRPDQVKNELLHYAKKDFAPYARYQVPRETLEKQIEKSKEKKQKNTGWWGRIKEALLTKLKLIDAKDEAGVPIQEKDVLPFVREYHKEVIGVDSPENRFVLTEGSTAALNHLIRMQAMEKAKDKKALGENCVLELFGLSYPLYKTPAQQVYMKSTSEIRLTTQIDVHDNKVVKSQPWHLVRESLTKSFHENRDKVAVFAFSNPANPSGYKLSHDEMDFMAAQLLEDFQYRKAKEIPVKLVLEDVAYATMMRNEKDRPYTLIHAFTKMIEAEQKKAEPDQKKIEELIECKQSVVTVHSLSKAAGVAGDRVAYSEGHPDIICALREKYTADMLSYANSTLHAALGAFRAGMPERAPMEDYVKRVQNLEEGLNQAYFEEMSKLDLSATPEQIAYAMPFANHSDGSFFTVMNLKPLLGQKVDADVTERINRYIARIPDKGIQNSFGTIFEGGKINDEKDLSLYFMFKTLEYGNTMVSCVPLDERGMIRFAAGTTSLEDIAQAVEASKKFFAQDPLYKRAISSVKETIPGTEINQWYKLDKLGVAHLATTGVALN